MATSERKSPAGLQLCPVWKQVRSSAWFISAGNGCCSWAAATINPANKRAKTVLIGLPSTSKRHQADMQHQPNRYGENRNSGQSLPSPSEMMGLNRINGDHEIITKPGM